MPPSPEVERAVAKIAEITQIPAEAILSREGSDPFRAVGKLSAYQRDVVWARHVAIYAVWQKVFLGKGSQKNYTGTIDVARAFDRSRGGARHAIRSIAQEIVMGERHGLHLPPTHEVVGDVMDAI